MKNKKVDSNLNKKVKINESLSDEDENIALSIAIEKGMKSETIDKKEFEKKFIFKIKTT